VGRGSCFILACNGNGFFAIGSIHFTPDPSGLCKARALGALAKNLPRRSRDKRVPPTDGLIRLKGQMSFRRIWGGRTGSTGLNEFVGERPRLAGVLPIGWPCGEHPSVARLRKTWAGRMSGRANAEFAIWANSHPLAGSAQTVSTIYWGWPKTCELSAPCGKSRFTPTPLQRIPSSLETSQDFGQG